jgi:serine/threonine protein kinase
MKDQEMLEKLRAEVSSAIEMLKEKHTGADLAEGRRLLEEAAGAVKKNAWSQAIDLAQKAQLAAKPTTEYLLGRAKNLEISGSQACKDGKLAECIELWGKALGEYEKVREIALQRKEPEIVKAAEQTMASIKEDINVANKNKANLEMHAYVQDANRAAEDGMKKHEGKEFDTAKGKFEVSRDLYSKGAKIAREFGFEDRQKLEEAVEEQNASITSCLIGKGEAMILTSSKEQGSGKEDAFSRVLKYLNSLSITGDEINGLKLRANRGLVQGRIEMGTKLMSDAETLLNKKDYYPAKEGYRKAQQHFESVRDFAVEQRLESEKGRIDNLIDDCSTNIRICTDSMLGRKKVAEEDLRRVADIVKGIKTKVQKPVEDTQSALEKVYASVRYLASGGFGDVWVAHTREGQTLALKILREPERHEEIFFKELEIWRKLIHRNIVRLIRPRVNPFPLFEMEYVDGGDLKVLMDKVGRFAPERGCMIAFDIARGLEYAHLSNVIHGDLKPRNILIAKTEEPKISDWGLGKIATSSSRAKGYTQGYAAPEQIKNEPIDIKTDTYQLGVVLYEMLTGQNPFQRGDFTGADEAVLTLIPEKPSKYNAQVAALDDVVMGCMEKKPEDRPAIRQFREILSKYMKENFGTSLSVSTQKRDQVYILCRNAILAAKGDECKECVQALNDLSLKITDRDLRESVRSLVKSMEYHEKEGLKISTDQVLDDIYSVLRQVEHGAS